MEINIRWIHFVLLLLLVLGGHSGLLGQPSEESSDKEDYAEPEGLPESIEPSSQQRKTATKTKYAICYRINQKTGAAELQSGCKVFFYNGDNHLTGGHQDDDNKKHEQENRTKGQRIPTSKEVKKDPTIRGDSLSSLSSTKKLDTEPTYLGVAQVGNYEGTDGFPFEINTSQVGQNEWVRACNGFPNPDTNEGNCKEHNFDVKYSDLKDYSLTIKANSKLMIPIGKTGTHPFNHYGTQPMGKAITAIATQYRAEFSCYKDGSLKYEPIGINDIALPYGGVFDVENNWRGPHFSHHRGKAVDIRCHSTNRNSVIYDEDIIKRFLQICRENGLQYAEHERKGTKYEHCHCGVSGTGEGEIIPKRRSHQ